MYHVCNAEIQLHVSPYRKHIDTDICIAAHCIAHCQLLQLHDLAWPEGLHHPVQKQKLFVQTIWEVNAEESLVSKSW